MTTQATTPGPPRLLLGATLLFWGGISGSPLIGLLAAVATEAAHWTRVRWEFSDAAFYRAWQTSIIALLLAGLLVWLNESVLSALPRTLVWLPLILFPLQFVQSYGMHRTMPLATFSLFVRKRRAHAELHGLPFRDVRFAFGWVYFAAILIASTVGTHADARIFFPGLILLITWAFHRQFAWTRRLAPIGALLMLALAAGGAYGGEKFFAFLYDHYVMGGSDGASLYDYRQTRTRIGLLRKIKQSPNILWRLKPMSGPLPTHLRIASYNSYNSTSWSTALPPDVQTGSEDFNELISVGADPPFRTTARRGPLESDFLPASLATNDELPRFTLRGAFPRQSLLPIPGNTASLVLPAQSIETNSFGSLRVDPKHPVANAVVLWNDSLTNAKPPWEDRRSPSNPRPDLRIPRDEADAIERTAALLELDKGGLDEKIQRIRHHFLSNFTYTRYLNEPEPRTEAAKRNFISIFLEESRRGHCEYYATATTFLLRQAGIPARYATGFAVVETHPKTGDAIIRGTHAHAWCMAWDEAAQTWRIVDLTPPDWTGMETPRVPAWQGLLDRWQILRDDLIVWRSQPGNLALAIVIVLVPLSVGGFLIGRRLWKSRRRLDPVAQRRKVRPQHAATPLSDFEKAASVHLGPRPTGTPLATWLQALSPVLSHPEQLSEAIGLHQALRFDPLADTSELRRALDSVVPQLRLDLESKPLEAPQFQRPSYP